ncbi:hypothetical protein [Microcella frigidaquae]|uniref:hypothetical protein n=1 Tax=Microcella frigidaquae TaxID=424758 RepID=UPI00161AD4A8|nr:hypothetical protein [Microcella frigidaquae]NHN45011.1 DUF3800 domain-containing protein [Microcella frigidaquae]
MPNTYLLAAAICSIEAAADLSASMLALKPTAARKLHWRDIPKRSRLRAVALDELDTADARFVVVVHHALSGERLERRRRLCMERLVQELTVRDVSEIVAESRGAADDQRDIDHFLAMRSRQVPGSRIRITHEAGPTNPALWAADIVAGAVASDLTMPAANSSRLSALTIVRTRP